MQVQRSILISLLILATAICQAIEYRGKVVSIADGDTATVLTTQKQQVKVRFHGIDAPEKRQPYGNDARQALARKIFNKDVTVKAVDTDRYGRTVGTVVLDGRDINYEMVLEGHAWAYRQYLKDKRFIVAEDAARSAKIGLWKLQPDQVMAPWEWRKAQKNGTSRQPEAKVASPSPVVWSTFSCGTKKYCKEMASCEEAKFYLEQCGAKRLDGNNDGVPCEWICGPAGGLQAKPAGLRPGARKRL